MKKAYIGAPPLTPHTDTDTEVLGRGVQRYLQIMSGLDLYQIGKSEKTV